MESKITKIVPFLLAIILLLEPSLSCINFAMAITEPLPELDEEKIYSTATMDDDFANNAIMIVLSEEKTKEFYNKRR